MYSDLNIGGKKKKWQQRVRMLNNELSGQSLLALPDSLHDSQQNKPAPVHTMFKTVNVKQRTQNWT